jgi:hypothetical protein
MTNFIKATDTARAQELLQQITVLEVPTKLLEMMKGDSKYYNNELDAELNNPHIKSAVLGLLARGVKFNIYHDGKNTLYYLGEGANMQRYTGTTMITS